MTPSPPTISINSLPAEILDYILFFAASGRHTGIVDKMLACKLWHASIVHQARLWNKVRLRFSVWREVVSRQKQAVEGCLARSNGSDLEVTLVIESSDLQEKYGPGWKYGYRTEEAKQSIAEIRGILDFLAGCSTSKEQREVPRWTFLAIQFLKGYAREWNEKVLTPFFSSHSFPRLRCVQFIDDCAPFDLSIASTPRLEEVDMGPCGFIRLDDIRRVKRLAFAAGPPKNLKGGAYTNLAQLSLTAPILCTSLEIPTVTHLEIYDVYGGPPALGLPSLPRLAHVSVVSCSRIFYDAIPLERYSTQRSLTAQYVRDAQNAQFYLRRDDTVASFSRFLLRCCAAIETLDLGRGFIEYREVKKAVRQLLNIRKLLVEGKEVSLDD